MPTTPHPEDPAEGSREAIERQLKRTEPEKGGEAKADRKRGQQQQGGTKGGGPGGEEAGRD